MELDKTDRTILAMLQKDAKMTIKELASALHITSTPVYERIKRLEREKYIKHYAAIVDRNKVSLSLMAFTTVSLDGHQSAYLDSFENDVKQLPEVIECYHIAGMFDYLLKVIVKDMEAYEQFVAKKLAALAHIGRVQSSFVMNEIKYHTSLPLENSDQMS
jgi:DNA-binding Lrp family transcriptional regulator